MSSSNSTGPSSTSNSASGLVSTLVPVFIYAAIFFILFLIFRKKFPRVYSPRSFLSSLPKHSRSPTLNGGGVVGWVKDFWAIADTYVLNHHTLDGYLFLRFLKLTVICCFVGCLITWPVLFPINATGGGGQTQLDILNMGNVTNKWKYFAHSILACIYFGFIIYMITRECIYYINIRQAYLMSPLYASRISSRTVLFTSVPDTYMSEHKLRAMLNPGIRRIWFATDCKDLTDKVDQRDKAAMKLEGAETKLIKTANKNRLKAEKKAAKHGGSEPTVAAESGRVVDRYVTSKDRPTHRLKMLIGKKVDTIDWCRAELQKLIPEVDSKQAQHKATDAKKLNSVFVEFETLMQAQSAYQSLTHHQALHMSPRFAGMTPAEVIWSNLRIRWWERVLRQLATTAFVIAMIVFWAIPVALVGIISNVNYLKTISFLTWIGDIPNVILGVVTGLLPSVMLAVLMALVPIILRFVAKLKGDPTLSAVELTVQNWYYAFYVVQGFLVTTLSSSATSTANTIVQNPTQAPMLLSQQLPKASNFYISYFILQGLASVSGILLALVGLALFMVLGKLLDNTPRKMYKRWISLSGIGWGTLFPIYTTLMVIAIVYSIIAPLVLGFATIGMFFFYFAYRYNLLFVTDSNIDCKGLVYPRALKQLFVGLYLAEVCLIGLFAVAVSSSVGAIGPLIIMIIMLIFTALYHVSLNSALGPLLNYLPRSLDAEERRLLEVESRGHGNGTTEGDKYAAAASDKEAANLADSSETNGLGAAPHKKPNMFTKWLRPDIYSDYETMRRLVPKEIGIQYSEQNEKEAFFNPAITSPTPLLWVPRDSMGISKQEIADTNKVIPITDEGAYLDEKTNKIVWDAQDDRPPVYEEKVYY